MDTRTKVLSAAASILLLGGIGGALAAWSDSAQAEEVFAKTGHLDLDMGDSLLWDISDLCQPTPGDLSSPDPTFQDCSMASGTPQELSFQDGTVYKGDNPFYMVPGDKILVVIPVTTNLAGANIAAKLQVTAANIGTASNGWLIVDLYDPDPTDTDGENKPQFSAKPYGLFQADDADSLLAQFKEQAPVAGANQVIYFAGDTEDSLAFAAFEIEFLNFYTDPDAPEVSWNDINGINPAVYGCVGGDGDTESDCEDDGGSWEIIRDLMDQEPIELLSQLRASLVQVRS